MNICWETEVTDIPINYVLNVCVRPNLVQTPARASRNGEIDLDASY